MIDEKEIMPLNFFSYGGIYSGEHKGMRYRILRTGEKPDYKLHVSIWQGPYAYAALIKYSPDKNIFTENDFEYSEEGRTMLVEWLKQQYDLNIDKWKNMSLILDAPINLDKIYDDK